MNRRYSKKRDQILNLLKSEREALSASQIKERLAELDLATIYRNLELFVSDGLVKKLSLDDKEAKYEYQNEPHHHAICEECKRVIHFKAPDEKIKKLLGLEDFKVDELEVTVRGICRHK